MTFLKRWKQIVVLSFSRKTFFFIIQVPKVGGSTKKSGSLSDSGNGTVKPATTTTTNGNRTMRKRRATGSFNAPFNSTQFLMNDHISEAVKHLNSTLNVKSKPEAVDTNEESSVDSNVLEQRPVRRITRARESSFSIGNFSNKPK